MSLERPQDSGKKRSSLLEAGAVATVMLAALDGAPARAELEIPPGTSWDTATTQYVRDVARQQDKEHALSFIFFPDGSSVMPTSSEGTARNVQYDSNKEFQFMRKQHGGKTIEIWCNLHTHNYQTFKAFTGAREMPYLPPSFQDINHKETAEARRELLTAYKRTHMNVKKSVQVTADARGLWYQTPTNTEEIDRDSHKRWNTIYSNFVMKSAHDPDFKFEVEYPKLRKAYQTYLKADVRFVPYEKVPQEPPCAGVDHEFDSLKRYNDTRVRPAAREIKQGRRESAHPAVNANEPKRDSYIGGNPPTFDVGRPQQ